MGIFSKIKNFFSTEGLEETDDEKKEEKYILIDFKKGGYNPNKCKLCGEVIGYEKGRKVKDFWVHRKCWKKEKKRLTKKYLNGENILAENGST